MKVGFFLNDLEANGTATINATQTKAQTANVTNALTKIPDLLLESQSPRLLRTAAVEELNPSMMTGTELEWALKARFIG